MSPTPPFPLRSCLAFLLFSPALAVAQQAPGTVTELESTRVIGTAIEQPLPTTTSTDAKTMDQRLIRSFDDLGRRAEPGVNFNRSNESINIRGLDRDRVLTTIDGIRVPWLTDGARSQGPSGGAQGGLDSVDFNGLSAVDIVRGSNSSQVGSGALGGAVQLRTLNPQDLLGNGKTFGSLIKTDYYSADDSWGLNAALAGRYQNTSWLLQGGQRQGHELENAGTSNSFGATRTSANPADTDQQSLLFKLQQDFEGGHKLGFTAEHFDRDYDIDSRSNQGGNYLIGDNSTIKHVRRERLSVDYGFVADTADGLLDHANVIAYWQKLRRNDDQAGTRVVNDARANIPDAVFQMVGGLPGNPYRYPSGAFGRDNQIEKELYGVSGEAGKTLRLADISHHLVAGAELYRVDTQQVSEGYDNCPAFSIDPSNPMYMGPTACDFLHTNQADMPKAEGSQWAIYARDEIGFADNTITLTPGIRYDAYRQQPKAGGDFANNVNPSNEQTLRSSSDHKLSGSLLATWQADDDLLLYAQWAQGFKAPDATQLYMNYGAEGSYLRLGNVDLKPEESNGFEVGAQLGDQRLGGSLALFDNRYKNFIDEDVAVDAATLASIGLDDGDYPLGVTRTQNRSKVRIYGAEATAHWEFLTQWKLWGSVAWAVGKDRQTNQHLSSVAPLSGLIGLGYETDHYGADLMLRAAAARNKVENVGDFKAPGYGVVDLTGYWQPVMLDGVKLQAGLFNALDKKYWNALNVPTGALVQPDDYYSEVGRNFRVSASWQF